MLLRRGLPTVLIQRHTIKVWDSRKDTWNRTHAKKKGLKHEFQRLQFLKCCIFQIWSEKYWICQLLKLPDLACQILQLPNIEFSRFGLPLGKMGHPWKKRVTLKKRRRKKLNLPTNQLGAESSFKREREKNVLHLEKSVTVENLLHLENCHTWKNGSHLEKWATLGKMGHTWKNGSNLENGSHLVKWVRLEKWVTLGKMGQT